MTANKKRVLLACIILLSIIILFAALYTATLKPPVQGSKNITILVAHGDGSQVSFIVNTEAQYLGEALQSEGLIAGETSQFGLFVDTVDGETANEQLQQWWCLTKSGQEWVQGVDTTTIQDGDEFEFTLTTGW